MQSTLTLLAALVLVAWGVTGTHASTMNDLVLPTPAVAWQQFAQASLPVDQVAWADDDEGREEAREEEAREEREDDDDEEEEAGERPRDRGDRESAERSRRMETPRRPIEMEQMRELMQKFRQARAAGNEEEAADLMRQIRERTDVLGRGPFGPRAGERPRGPQADRPPREGQRPPMDRGVGDRADRPRGDRGPAARPAEARQGNRPAQMGRAQGPRAARTQPGRRGPGGPANARRGPWPGAGRPGAPAQRGGRAEWRRPGTGPWGGPPAMRGAGGMQFRPGGPPRGPGRTAALSEIRELREELQALRKAIEELTEQVEAARQQR